jgi:phi LC3 family holin
MRINIPLRFKNKVTLLAIISLLVRIVIAVLALFAIKPPVSYDALMNVVKMSLDLLVLVGVITDPTTPGIGDSEKAMGYTELGGEKQE